MKRAVCPDTSKPLLLEVLQRFAIVFFVSMLAVVCQAEGAALTLEPVEAVNLSSQFTVLEDPSQRLTKAEVSAPTFDAQFRSFAASRSSLQLGSSTSAYWLKLEVFNPKVDTLIRFLEIDNPLLPDVQMHRLVAQGRWESIYTGHGKPYSSRPYDHRNFIFPLQFAGDTKTTIYFRLQGVATSSLVATLWNEGAFEAHERQDYTTQAAFFGFAVAVALVQLALYLATREALYALYGACIVGASATLADRFELLHTIMPWDGTDWGSDSYLALLAVFMALIASLVQKLFLTPPQFPWLSRAFKGYAVFCTLFPLMLLWPALASDVLPWMLGLFNMLMLSTAFYLANRKVPEVHHLVAAYAVLFLGLSVVLLDTLGLLGHSTGADTHLLLGYTLSTLLMGYTIARRIAELNREKHKAQSALTAMQNEAIEKLRTSEMTLEAMVSRRTQELQQAATKLESLSAVDGLTGVANRRRFDQMLQIEWRRAARAKRALSLAIIDVDWFKPFNDRYGHQAGDECLRRLARVFEAGIMRSGDLIARYGGEEFVLIAPDTDVSGIVSIANYLCQEVFGLAIAHDSSPYGRVSVSIGVASAYPNLESTPGELLLQADTALYAAKQQGRHRVSASLTQASS